MKKILLIGVVLISCVFCLNVKAEEIVNNPLTSEESLYEFFERKTEAIHWWTDYGMGEFSENETPTSRTIIDYMVYEMDTYFEEYAECDEYTDPETGETWETGCTFSVPANYFEDILKKSFNVNDEYILADIRLGESSMGSFAYIEKMVNIIMNMRQCTAGVDFLKKKFLLLAIKI